MSIIKDFQDIGSVAKSVVLGRSLPETKFYIFGTGRCGSTLLVGLLNCHSQISCDQELLSARSYVPKSALFKRVYHCPTPVYGFKLLMYHMTNVHHMQSPIQFIDWLNKQNFKVVYLRRQNRFQHAISLVVSAKRKVLHEKVLPQDASSLRPVEIDPVSVLETVAKFEANYQAEQELLKHIPHLPLVYEEHLENGQRHQQTSNLVFDYLGLKPEPVKAKLRKIMPMDLRQSILNYEEVMSAIDRSEYAYVVS